jgi:molybdopterin molybdotransferase
MLGIARDTIEDLTAKMRTAMNYDILLTTGGVSEGKFDFIEKVMNELGIVIHFNAIKMKPGKPMVFGTLKNSLFFGLPGNPVSTMVGFIEYVRPALLRMMDAIRIAKPLVNAVSKDQILKKAGRTHFIRGYFTLDNGSFFVSTTGPQGSGILRSMSTANCLIILPENQTIVQPGEIVKIQLINHEEI